MSPYVTTLNFFSAEEVEIHESSDDDYVLITQGKYQYPSTNTNNPSLVLIPRDSFPNELKGWEGIVDITNIPRSTFESWAYL